MIVNADARSIPLADRSVHCVVTSPPYFGLRDYGNARWEGGDAACAHSSRPHVGGLGRSTLAKQTAEAQRRSQERQATPYRDRCLDCGAVRVERGIGLEDSLEEWVDELVAVFREIRRVLRDDGIVWLNLGDAYAGAPNGGGGATSKLTNPSRQDRVTVKRSSVVSGLKPKDLLGQPWRVAFALQANGWYLRADVIWHKPNPMPESARDRPTRAHEYVFLLTKSPRYHYDADAISEEASPATHARVSQKVAAQIGSMRAHAGGKTNGAMKAFGGGFGVNPKAFALVVGRRNKRTVWEIGSEPFSEAHFAVFPTALVEPCVKAGCPEGGVVLDPFAGSGTTGVVARKLGRRFVGVELNAEYCEMATRRIRAEGRLIQPRSIRSNGFEELTLL